MLVMKKVCTLLAVVCAAMSGAAKTITMTNADAWNVYKPDGKTPIRSFVDGDHWSDLLPPHADADYVLDKDQFAVNIHANEKTGGQTFGGKSLSLNGSSNRIYFHWNMQNPEVCWDYPVTIGDLTLNGVNSYLLGESSTYTANRYVLRGKLTVNGTESAWPQHIENSKGDGSWMYVESKLVGGPSAFFAVRTLNRLSLDGTHAAIPDPADPTKPSETALTGADFSGDLSEFSGTLWAGTNAAIRIGDDCPGTVRLSGPWSALGSCGANGATVNVARVRFHQGGMLLASDRFATLAVTNSFVTGGRIKVRLFEPKDLAYIAKFDILNVPMGVATLADGDFVLDSDNPDLSLKLSARDGVQTLSLVNAGAVEFLPYMEINADCTTYAGKNDYIGRLRQNFTDNYQPETAAQFVFDSGDAFYAPGSCTTRDTQGETRAFPFWSDGLAPHPGADYVVYPEIWAPKVYERALIMPRGAHTFAGDSLTIPDHSYLHFNDTASDVTIDCLRLLNGGSIRMYSNGADQQCVLRGHIEILADAQNPAKIRLTGSRRELEIAADITGDENAVIMITCDHPDAFVTFTGDLSGFRGRIIYPYESDPAFVQLKASDPKYIPAMADRSQLSYFYAGGWSDATWPHAGTNYCVGAGKTISLMKTSSISSTNCVDRGMSYGTYWKNVRFYGDVLAVAGTMFVAGDTSNDGYAFKIPDLRLVSGAKIAFPDNYDYDSYFDCQADGTTTMRVESTRQNPVVIEGTRRADRTFYIGMSLVGDRNAALRIVNQSPASGGRSTVRFNGDVTGYTGSITVGNNMNLVIDRAFRGEVILEGNASAAYAEVCGDAIYDDADEIEVADSAALAAAVTNLREKRMNGELTPKRPVAIVLKPGDYLLDTTLTLTASDSGSREAPLIFRAQRPGTVRLLGAKPFDGSGFAALDERDPWYRTFPAEALGSIRTLDASGLIDGELPAWKTVSNITGSPWFFADGHFQDLSRYPNRLDDEQYYGMLIANCTNEGDGNGGAVLQLADRRPDRWNFTRGDIYIHGYYRYLWHEDYIRVSRWDKSSGAIVLGGKPTYPPILGKPAKELPVHCYNIPEELDRAEEWWLDRDTRRLYCIPRPGASEFALVSREAPLVRFARTAHDIRFENLTFAYAYQAFSSSTDLRRITFSGCTFESLVNTSDLNGEKCHVTGCEFRRLGCGGVRLNGGERGSLKRGDNVVEFCSFSDFERLEQCNAPGAAIYGCGDAIRNCTFREAGHQGAYYKGNEHFIGWSTFDKVVRLNEDCGAIYTGRDPAALGCAIVGCKFSNFPGHDRSAVYYDDCNWGDATYGNTFRNVYRAMEIGGGNLHRTKWNAFYDCSVGIHLDSRGYSRSDFVTSERWWAECAAKYPSDRYPWTAAYPGYLAAIADHPAEPKQNVFESCYMANCKQWTTIVAKPQNNYYPAYSNGMSMAAMVTVSTSGVAGTGFRGWTHYNWNAGTDKVAGLDAALARIAAQSNNCSRVRCLPGITGDVSVEVGVGANERLTLSAKLRGDDYLEEEPLYGAISCYKDYARYVKPGPASVATVGGAQVLSVPLTDYIDDDRNAVLEVMATPEGDISYRFATTNGATLVDWRSFTPPAADIRSGVLYVDVAAGETRPLNSAECAALIGNRVSGVVKTGYGVLVLDRPLTGYSGYWNKLEGVLRVTTGIDPFGSAGVAAITINDDTSLESNLADLDIACSCVIKRPVSFVAANTRLFSVAENETVRFTKRITMSGNCPRSYLETGSTCVVEGGLSSTILFTCTGPGTFVFEGAPITARYIWLESGNHLVFNSGTNNVEQISCSTTVPGSTIYLNNPRALKPGICRIYCYNGGSTYISDLSQLKSVSFVSGVRPPAGHAYIESDDISLTTSLACMCDAAFAALADLAPTDIELFRGRSSLTASDTFLRAATDKLPKGFTVWKDGNSVFAHISQTPDPEWLVLDGGYATNAVFKGMLIAGGTLNLGSDWIAKTVTGTLAFDSAAGSSTDPICIKTRMTAQYLEGPLVAGRQERVHFADFRDTASPRLPVTATRDYNGVTDYYLLNTAFWYFYYLRGECSRFEATGVAEWGAAICLDRPNGTYAGGFELGNFAYLGAHQPGVVIGGDIVGRDAWLRVTTGSSLEVRGKLDFGWATDASRAGIYPKAHTVSVYTRSEKYRVNAISVQPRASLTLNEAVLDDTLVILEGDQSSVTIGKLSGTPQFSYPEGYRLMTSGSAAGKRYSIVRDPRHSGFRMIFR